MSDPTPRRFTIEHCVGSGGFGEVYRATMRSPGGLSSLVALKVLRAGIDPSDDAVARLRDEGALMALIAHPVVVRAHDLGRIEGRVALISDFVEGADLDGLMRPPHAIEVRALLQVVSAVASALDAAWRTPGPDGTPLSLVHRDVKPTNIRVGKHGDVKLLDFGIARYISDDRQARTDPDVVVGSLPYMAPERFTAGGTQPASDVFGLGCCLFEGMAHVPFHAGVDVRTASGLALDELAYDRMLHTRLALLEGAPPQAVDLVEQCLAWNPEERPTAAMLAESCEALADDLPGPSLRRWARASPWPDAPHLPAPLDGRTIEELPVGAPADTRPDRDEGGPQIRQRPLGTLDPGMFEDGGTLAKKPRPPPPRAPPAFPSIPLGTAIDQLLISELEVSEALGHTAAEADKPAPAERPVKKAKKKPRPKPVRYEDEDEPGILQWVLLGAGCLILSGALAGVAAGLVAILLYILLL